MKLILVINKYVAQKQAMGMRFHTEAAALQSYARAIGPRNMADIHPKAVKAYLQGGKSSPFSQHDKFQRLRRFYRFALARGYATSSPLPTPAPAKMQSNFLPYIYTAEELRRLSDIAHVLDRKRGRLDTDTFRTLLVTLYGTGLRISEALSLTFADVDLREALLIIRDSKFFKTRWVPLGPRLRTLLEAYSAKRRRCPCPSGENSTFFATRQGTPIGRRSCAEYVFRQLCDRAGIRRSDGSYWEPRLHDIRHTFAVHRLVAWYRQGADVQRLLPSLATFIGHRDIDSLQRYLTMTPELLKHASRRFEHYALSEVKHV